MDELQKLFSSLDEREAEELLKEIEVPQDAELSEKIKERLGVNRKKQALSIRRLPLKALVPFAAMLCIFLVAIFTLTDSAPEPQITETSPTVATTAQQPPEDNPLMTAISDGNDDLVSNLLTLPGLISRETLDFALNFANLLSYDTIHQIALSTLETLGSTDLDALVESALLGDSEKALAELEKRDSMLMTPFEKLAFFFAVAFCDSEVVDAFVQKGYDINTKDPSGNSIYAIAKKYGNESTAQYAVSKGITS